MKKSDEQMTRQAKEAFDSSVDRLDAATLSRLNRSRHAALAEASRPREAWLRWIPATGIAAAMVLAVMMLQGPEEFDAMHAPANDLEILLGEESIDMLEDLEFYSWLDSDELQDDGNLG